LVCCCGVDLVVDPVRPSVCSGHCAAAAGALQAVVVVLYMDGCMVSWMERWMGR
jgi:hypothetical protein